MANAKLGQSKIKSNFFGKKITIFACMLHPQTSLRVKGPLMVLDSPSVMGILNLTPDSFFDGGKYNQSPAQAVERAGIMLEEGADIIDLGGMSSRPGAKLISAEEEADRVLPVLEALIHHFPEAVYSIDSLHASVARQAIQAGAHLINDISAARIDTEMFQTAAELQVPYILMHMQGLPQTMQQNPDYHNVVQEVFDFFTENIKRLRQLGLHDIILDPGFGFGKSLSHNYSLLRHLSVFKAFDLPILVGVSRKSMINNLLHIRAEEALNGTTAVHLLALEGGADILRVHDVAAAREAIAIWKAWQQATTP